jgi:hypothetical protein
MRNSFLTFSAYYFLLISSSSSYIILFINYFHQLFLYYLIKIQFIFFNYFIQIHLRFLYLIFKFSLHFYRLNNISHNINDKCIDLKYYMHNFTIRFYAQLLFMNPVTKIYQYLNLLVLK